MAAAKAVEQERLTNPDGVVAQLVEQRTENPRVVGSIPTLATTFLALDQQPALGQQPPVIRIAPVVATMTHRSVAA